MPGADSASRPLGHLQPGKSCASFLWRDGLGVCSYTVSRVCHCHMCLTNKHLTESSHGVQPVEMHLSLLAPPSTRRRCRRPWQELQVQWIILNVGAYLGIATLKLVPETKYLLKRASHPCLSGSHTCEPLPNFQEEICSTIWRGRQNRTTPSPRRQVCFQYTH